MRFVKGIGAKKNMKSIVFLLGAYANSELILDFIYKQQCREQDVSEYFSFITGL